MTLQPSRPTIVCRRTIDIFVTLPADPQSIRRLRGPSFAREFRVRWQKFRPIVSSHWPPVHQLAPRNAVVHQRTASEYSSNAIAMTPLRQSQKAVSRCSARQLATRDYCPVRVQFWPRPHLLQDRECLLFPALDRRRVHLNVLSWFFPRFTVLIQLFV